jgi:hypothetical protein
MAVLQFTFLPLPITFATAIMMFSYLESIDDGFHFCFRSSCFVKFSTAVGHQVLSNFLAGVLLAEKPDLSIFSSPRKALPSFASPVVLHLPTAP